MKGLYVAVVAAAVVALRLGLRSYGRRRRSAPGSTTDERSSADEGSARAPDPHAEHAPGRELAERRRRTAPSPTRARELFERAAGEVGLVAAREVRERTRGRMFRIGTLVILAAVAAAIVIPSVHSTSTTTRTIGVVGSLPASLERDLVAAGAALHETVRIARERDVPAATRDLRSGRIALAIVGAREVVTKDPVQATDTSAGAALFRAAAAAVSLHLAFTSAGITPAQAAALARAPSAHVTSLARPRSSGAARPTSVYGLILLFILLQQYGAWTLMGVLEEKASRVVEVLLAAVRPVQLLAGKVLGIGIVALAQSGLVVAFALVLAKAV
ncbi:MAG: ABC transporter permease, partial [Actinomycetota bacterium]|nr:ABC transporter permease [Actinomycetota bacterium]